MMVPLADLATQRRATITPPNDCGSPAAPHDRADTAPSFVRPRRPQGFERVDKAPQRHAKRNPKPFPKVGVETVLNLLRRRSDGVKKRGLIGHERSLVFRVRLSNGDEGTDLAAALFCFDGGREHDLLLRWFTHL